MKNKIKISLLLLVAMMLTFNSCTNKKENTEESTIADIKANTAIQKKDSSESKTEEILKSEITCPKCEYKKMENLPTEICLISYTCENCKTVLHPKNGDCCVFCTYGDHKCPSKQ